jgi:hypothetical protein
VAITIDTLRKELAGLVADCDANSEDTRCPAL